MKLNKGANNGLPHVVAWVLAVLAVGMLCWVTQHMVQAEWRERDQTARREVSNMSRLSQEHALRTLRAADQALQLVRALYLRDGDHLKLADWVNQGAIDVSVFHQVGIIDAKGIYRLSNLPETPLVDLSDREHFKAHLGQKGDVLFVSKPVLGRVSKKWTIQLTRPIMHADGRFGGVAVVSVDADYFASFYASLDLGKSGAAAMVGTDGVLRARRSSQPASTGSVMGISVKESPALKLMTNGVTEGFSENASPIDQVRRLHHFRMIEGYPLYVAVALGVDDYQAASRAAERQSWMMTALGCSLIFGLAGLFSWHWQREQRQRRVLMDSKAYTQLALDGGGIGVWEWDLQHNRFTLDARLWAMLGYVPGELDTTLQVFMAHVHPQDSARVRKLLTAVLKGEVPRLAYEHRLRHKDGHWVWLMARAQVVERGADGRALRLMGTDVDRTEHKQTEEAQRVAAVAFESSAAMTVSDADKKILRVNPAFEALSGYTFAQAVGQDSGLLRSDRHDAAFYRAMWSSLQTSGHWEGELWNRRRDGEVFLDWLAISVVKDKQGQVTHYVSVHADITLRKRSEDEVRKLAFFDPLTGLPNRRLLLDRLQQMTAAYVRHGQIGAVLFTDLDHFKPLNDTHGHALGDELLIQVAQRLLACVREVDTVARLGGDEFVVTLAQLGSDASLARDMALAVGQKIRQALHQPFVLGGITWQLSASMGIALLLDTQKSAEDLLKDADAAMYAAKEAGRNAVQVFDAGHRHQPAQA